MSEWRVMTVKVGERMGWQCVRDTDLGMELNGRPTLSKGAAEVICSILNDEEAGVYDKAVEKYGMGGLNLD